MDNLKPLKRYTPPNLPVLESICDKRELLKKLPLRWQKIFGKSAALACVGVIGLAAFTACSSPYVPQLTEEEIRERMEIAAESYINIRANLETTDLRVELRGGFGCAGAFSVHIVYFTEQEAWSFIQAQLEAAGLNFDSTPPRYSVNIRHSEGRRHWPRSVGFQMYDAQKNVGIARVDDSRYVQYVSRELSERSGMPVGVFYNPFVPYSRFFGWSWRLRLDEWSQEWREEHGTIGYEGARAELMYNRQNEMRQYLIENLTSQAQNFITHLQEEGVL